jgi:hypothetical protein
MFVRACYVFVPMRVCAVVRSRALVHLALVGPAGRRVGRVVRGCMGACRFSCVSRSNGACALGHLCPVRCRCVFVFHVVVCAPLVACSLRDVWTCWELWGRQGTFPARGAARTAGSQFTCTWDDGEHSVHRELWVGEVSPAGPHAMCTTPLWSPIDPATTGEHDHVHYVILRMRHTDQCRPEGPTSA